jgi:hypothetical protein
MATTNLTERVARICHEVNRAYCAALGDTSQQEWEHAPDWQKSSARNGVALHMQHPEAGPQASHESWMAEKIDAGWVYGPVKDPEKKEHPCMVPFEQLPSEQQAKDFIFRGVVGAVVYDALMQRAEHAESAAARAQAMWAAYSKQAGGATFDQQPLPTWEGLGEDRQACWLAAAAV